MDYGKFTVAFEIDGTAYKLCKVFFGRDGSYYVTSPYHPAERAVLFKATVDYTQDEMDMHLAHALDVGVLDDDDGRLKLSHHPDGFVQFSGKGIVSGKDDTGKILGIGVGSWPLTAPTCGPAFGVTIVGVSEYERLERSAPNMCLFREGEVEFVPGWTNISIEGYYFPPLWGRFVRQAPDGTRMIPIVHPAGAMLTLRVLAPSKRCTLQGFIGVELYTVSVSW
jgi:hypothetical protein